jgi:hypothetical protein
MFVLRFAQRSGYRNSMAKKPSFLAVLLFLAAALEA